MSDPVRDLLAAHALGLLEGEELEQLQSQLRAGDPELERELREWREVVASLAEQAGEPIVPSAATRARLLERIAESGPSRLAVPKAEARARSVPWSQLLAAAALLLAVVGLLRLGAVERRLGQIATERDRLAQRLEQISRELVETEARVERLASTVQMISSPDTQSVLLAGLEDAPQALGAAFVRAAQRKAVFYAWDLPALTPDRTYQLWFITGAGPESAGVFAVDAEGTATLQLADLREPAQIQAWAVTVEPAGGVPQPTGPMVLRGLVA